jgi:radical SAM protein with 4Fe4S-binding SPASM domain
MSDSPELENRNIPRNFVLELTRRCNNRCVYCYLSCGVAAAHSKSALAAEMSTDEVLQLIARLHQEVGLNSLALSGGESLLREDLPQILSFLRELNIQPVVISNGTLLTPDKIKSLMDGVTFEVTLLSHRHSVHDRMVGHRGAWEAVVANLTHLRRAKGTFVAVFVATKLNWNDLRKTAELAIALGADALMYNRMNLAAHNFHMASQLLPSAKMIAENLDTLEEFGAKYQLPISVSVVIEPCVLDTARYKHIHFGWCPLGGEDSYFTIDPSGNLRICNHSPKILGNLRQQSFRSIYFGHPDLRLFRDTLPDECAACRPEWKTLCRGGCKAAAEQCYGSSRRIDPFVTLSSLTGSQDGSRY